MAVRSIPQRSELPVEKTWDLGSLYTSDDEWEADLRGCEELLAPILQLEGSLGRSAENLRNALEAEDILQRHIEKLHTYAHLKNDQDLGNSKYQGMFDRISSLYHDYAARLAWINPEIMAIDETTMRGFLASEELSYYRFALEVMLRFRPHTLSNNEERIMAMAGEALGTPYKAFSRLNNADLRFPEVPDGKGGTLELSHANFIVLLESQDREVRRKAFEAL